MGELALHEQAEISVLDGLASEARYYSESIALNMVHLGRVLVDAKKLVKHGEWGAWLRTNAGCSERTAQQFMQVYTRFGNNAACASIEKSKLFKMLALPAGSEDDFMQENDVSEMSSREVEAAVREVRERAERAEAELEALKNRPTEIPEEVTEELRKRNDAIEKQKAEMQRMHETSKDLLEEAARLRKDNSALARERDESAELLQEVQQEFNRAQEELLNTQSMLAKGDAERTPSNELTLEAFGGAVRQFIGACARMPHMTRTFGMMDLRERNAYDELLRTMEGWAAESRRAMDTVFVEEVIEV